MRGREKGTCSIPYQTYSTVPLYTPNSPQVLITISFFVIWVLMSIPLYANVRTFDLELAVKWAFGIGFVDSMIYGACVR